MFFSSLIEELCTKEENNKAGYVLTFGGKNEWYKLLCYKFCWIWWKLDQQFLYRSTRNNSYTLFPIESNYLKCARIQTVHSNEFKLSKKDISYYVINCADFEKKKGGGRWFLCSIRRNKSFRLVPIEPNLFKVRSNPNGAFKQAQIFSK